MPILLPDETQDGEPVINPPFMALVLLPQFATCLTKHKKINHKHLPKQLPDDVELTYNGIRVNPSEGRARLPAEAEAHREWSKLAVAFNTTQTKPSGTPTPKNRAKANEERKAKRQATATEAKALIWWITFCNTMDDGPRFGGCRTQCYRDVVAVFNMCDAWLAHCQEKSIEEPNHIDATPGEAVVDDSSSEEEYDDEEYVIDDPGSPDRFEDVDKEMRPEFETFIKDVKPDYDDKDLLHWYVVCLEGPGDMNFFAKRKKPLDRKLFVQMMEHMRVGLDQTDIKRIHFQVVREQRAFSIARYLAFGYCSDGHKQYGDVDKEPLFGPGDIDIPVNNLRTWLQHSIELAGHRKFSDMHFSKKKDDRTGESRSWFTAISSRCNATVRMFEDMKMVLLGDADNDNLLGERSTPAIRMAKLYAAANPSGYEADTNYIRTWDDDITRLFIILAWHGIEPSTFARCVRVNLFEERDSKKQIMISAPSNGGKSAIFDRIIGPAGSGAILISEAINHSSKKSASLRMYASLNSNRQCDCIVFPEFGKVIKSGQLTQSMALALLEDSRRAEETYLRGLARLPCLAMNQVPFVKLPDDERDKMSLMNRLEVLEFKGPRLPESYKDRWHISTVAMARYLLGQVPTPDWFLSVSKMFKLYQRNVRDAKSQYGDDMHPRERFAAFDEEDKKFYEYVEKYLFHKFPTLWNAENKAATEQQASVNINTELDEDEMIAEYEALHGHAPPAAKRARNTDPPENVLYEAIDGGETEGRSPMQWGKL